LLLSTSVFMFCSACKSPAWMSHCPRQSFGERRGAERACLCSMIFQYPKFGSGNVQTPRSRHPYKV
jgi:hypothetical protein